MSRKSGIMEWCEGTMPLGDFLIGGRNKKVGAHQRYYPADWRPSDCRARLTVSKHEIDTTNIILE